MEPDKFIFCLEAVPDVEIDTSSEVVRNLEQLAFKDGIASIYKTCDTIEGLQESLNSLLYEDHNFQDYEIIYLVIQGQGNNICIRDYYYSLEEIAELFEGKMTAKILHFANSKVLDLSAEEAQYFLDITGARALSGYGAEGHNLNSILLDKAFFSLCHELDDITEVVDVLYKKHYALCERLDFIMYY